MTWRRLFRSQKISKLFRRVLLLLLLGLFSGVLGRLMMTDDASSAGAEHAVMTGIMPGDTADNGALQTASGLQRRRNPTGSHQKGEGPGQ
jgi:hypothetical protein